MQLGSFSSPGASMPQALSAPLTPDMSNLGLNTMGANNGMIPPQTSLLSGMSSPSGIPSMENPQTFLGAPMPQRFGQGTGMPTMNPTQGASSVLGSLGSGNERIVVVPIIINGNGSGTSPQTPMQQPQPRMGASAPPMAFNGTPMMPPPSSQQMNPATALTVNALGGPNSEVGKLYTQVGDATQDVKNILLNMNTSMQGMLGGASNPQAMNPQMNPQNGAGSPMPTGSTPAGMNQAMMPNASRMGAGSPQGMLAVDPNASLPKQVEMAKQMAAALKAQKAQKGQGVQPPQKPDGMPNPEGMPEGTPPEALAAREKSGMPPSPKEMALQKRLDKLEAMVAQLLEEKGASPSGEREEMPPNARRSSLASREPGGRPPFPTRMGSGMPSQSPLASRSGMPETPQGGDPSGEDVSMPSGSEERTRQALALIAKYDAKIKSNLGQLQARMPKAQGTPKTA
ncbi:MAG: hypothetical protein ACKO37_04455 [Vampirovibrionales bacterium]